MSEKIIIISTTIINLLGPGKPRFKQAQPPKNNLLDAAVPLVPRLAHTSILEDSLSGKAINLKIDRLGSQIFTSVRNKPIVKPQIKKPIFCQRKTLLFYFAEVKHQAI